MTQKILFSLISCAAFGLTLASCGGDTKHQHGAYSYQIAPRKGLSNNYITCNVAEGNITRLDGWLVAQDHQTFTAEDVFDPKLNVRFDSLRLSRWVEQNGTVVVGYLYGAIGERPTATEAIHLHPDGKVTTSDYAGNFVVKVEPKQYSYFGAATQREVKRRGAQGGTLYSTKNVIDTLCVGAHLFPNGDLFVGRMTGDLGTERPDFLEGFYETTKGEIYYLPTEHALVDNLVKQALKAQQMDANAKWAKLRDVQEDLSELYGTVEEHYDTPPTIGGQPAATAPLKLLPYEIGRRPADSHTLTIRFLVQPDGRPTAIEVSDCKDPEAIGAAKGLIRQQTIQPARKGSKPVKAWVKRTLTYQTARNQ